MARQSSLIRCRHLIFRLKYSEFSNFHLSVGSQRWAIPRPARAQMLPLPRSGGPGRGKVLLFCSSEQACLIHDPPSDICHFGSAPLPAANAAAVNQDSAVRRFLRSGRFPDERQSFILRLISSFCAKHKLSTDLKPAWTVTFLNPGLRRSTSIHAVCSWDHFTAHRHLALTHSYFWLGQPNAGVVDTSVASYQLIAKVVLADHMTLKK